MNLKKLSIFPLAVLCLISAATPCCCQDNNIYTINGEITSLDSIKGVIVVRWLQNYPTINYDNIVLKVPEGLKIAKGTDTIGFDDVNQFDRVTVQYERARPVELPIVVSMIVKESD